MKNADSRARLPRFKVRLDSNICTNMSVVSKHDTNATEAEENAQTGLNLDTEEKRGQHLELLACY